MLWMFGRELELLGEAQFLNYFCMRRGRRVIELIVRPFRFLWSLPSVFLRWRLRRYFWHSDANAVLLSRPPHRLIPLPVTIPMRPYWQ